MGYIEMRNSCKTYQMGETKIFANRDVSFSIEKGELAIILGSSGAGKSTVLNILGGMDTNDSGNVIIDGKDISKYNARQLTTYRRNDVGFVFQFYNLVPNLTSKENVELASEIVKDALDPLQVLKDVGLAKIFRRSFRVGNSSVLPLRERSQRIRKFCCVTNQPVRWIIKLVSRCFRFFRTCVEKKRNCCNCHSQWCHCSDCGSCHSYA